MRPPTESRIVVVSPRTALGCLVVAALACGDEPVAPPAVASIEVTSPIGNRLAVARTARLGAAAKDANGAVIRVIVSFEWRSAAPTIATISEQGIVSGVAMGDATISATANGVTGNLAIRVIAADLSGVGTTLADPFLGALVTNLTGPVRTRVQAALAQCSTGLTDGNFTTLESCLAGVRVEVTGATDPTDRALLASVALFIDHIQRLLKV